MKMADIIVLPDFSDLGGRFLQVGLIHLKIWPYQVAAPLSSRMALEFGKDKVRVHFFHLNLRTRLVLAIARYTISVVRLAYQD